MSGSVRERRPGVWELRPYLGRDPLTGKKRYGSRIVQATGKRDAQAQCDRWAVELADGDETPTAGTFGDLASQWIAVKERRWPPNTLQEHRRIVARNLAPLHDVDVTKITTHTLDVLYAELALAAAHAPTVPARLHRVPSTAHDADARNASVRRARTTAPARPGHRATPSRAGTARPSPPPVSFGSTPSCAPRSAKP
jgi:hypothetical protein